MPVGRRTMACAAIGFVVAMLPLSAAVATGEIGTCLPAGCVDLDAPDEIVDAADEVGQGTGEVVGDTKETSDKLTGGAADSVTDPVVDGINDILDLTPGQPGPVLPTEHKKDRPPSERETDSSTGSGDVSAVAIPGYERTFEMIAAREARRSFDAGSRQAGAFLPPSEPGLSERLSEAAVDAAKAFTFPAILIGLVVGFVLVQDRIDHRDPKLALAPVSSEQDFLSFS